MANNFLNASDVRASIARETAPGQTPSTGSRLMLPIKTSFSIPTYTDSEINFEIMRPNRASDGTRRGVGSGTGTFDLALGCGDVFNLLLESAASGQFNAGVLKAGKTDTTFTTFTSLADDMHYVDAGCMVNSVTIGATAAEGVTTNFNWLNTTRAETAAITGLTQTAYPQANYFFDGSEVTNISVGGASLIYSSLNLEIGHDRAARNALGNKSAVGISTSGTRTITLTLTAYRESFAINSVVTGQKQPVTFDIGTEDYGFRFTLPAATGKRPTDEANGDLLTTIEFTAAYDETAGTDLVVTQL